MKAPLRWSCLRIVKNGFFSPAHRGVPRHAFPKCGRSKRKGEAYAVWYVEPLSDARTKLKAVLTILGEKHGRPCTMVGGRPWLALRTPESASQFCCSRPARTSEKLLVRERVGVPGACVPQRWRRVFLRVRLKSGWTFMPRGTANRIPVSVDRIESPPSARRAVRPGGVRSSIATLLPL